MFQKIKLINTIYNKFYKTENFLSGGAMTLIFTLDGANAISSFESLSGSLLYNVVPPDRTKF